MSEDRLSTECVAAMAEMAGAPLPDSRVEAVAATLAAFGPLLAVVRDVDVADRPAARFVLEPWGDR